MRLYTVKELDQTEGTVQLRQPADGDGTASELVLVPHPSDTDPNDPLRWPRWKKHVAFTSVYAFAFLTNYAIGGLAPAFYLLSLEFNKSMTETRPIFFFASLLLCVCYIWGAAAKTFNSLLWSNIVAAFAGSSTEALGAEIVNDLYFLHERGAKMGIYMNSISGGNTIGPLICGFIVQSLGWRGHKWIAVIFTGINFLAVALFVPETRYDRTIPSSLSPVMSDLAMSSSDEETPVEKMATLNSKVSESLSRRAERIQVPKKTFIQELSLWSGTPANTNLFKTFIRPFPLLACPAVTYAFLGYSVALAWVVAVNILNSFILQAPPYNWQSQINGLINIPGLLGNLFGVWAGGSLVNSYCAWRTVKNNGIFQPETRLVLLIVPTLIVPAGCLLFGYGVERSMSWVALFFGYGLVSVGLTAVPTITMAYASDLYLPINGGALLLINGLKNIVAFGFLCGVVPWVTKVGYVDSFGTQAGLFVAIIGLGLPLYYFGERIRHRTTQWRIIL